MKRACLLFVALLLSGCAPKLGTKRIAPAPARSGPSEDEIAYREGLKAFREATPEGYERAVASFRKADKTRPGTCEYVMHLSEALFFLAQLQRQNWEDFQPLASEAKTILVLKRGAPQCNAFESYISRLQALSMTFDGFRQVEIVDVIRHAIATDPGDPLNWVVLSQVNPDPGRGDLIAPSQHAAALAPDLPLVQYELGNYYLRNQPTFAKAKEAFERTLEMNPRHFQSIIGVVYSLSVEGDDAADRVEPLLKKAAEIAPAWLRVRTLLGDHYSGIEETDLAVEQYKAATTQRPAYYPAHLAQGTALVTADRAEEAEPSFDAVIKLDVRRPHPPYNGVDYTADGLAHYYIGNIWLERGDLIKARAEYDQAVNDISNYAAAIYGLGIVSYREGKIDDALTKLNQVIQLNPTQFPNAFLARGGIRAERRQYNEALTDFNQAIEIYRQQVVALEAKAKVDEEKGRIKRAEGGRRRKALIEAALEKALESKKAVELLRGGVASTTRGAEQSSDRPARFAWPAEELRSLTLPAAQRPR